MCYNKKSAFQWLYLVEHKHGIWIFSIHLYPESYPKGFHIPGDSISHHFISGQTNEPLEIGFKRGEREVEEEEPNEETLWTNRVQMK